MRCAKRFPGFPRLIFPRFSPISPGFLHCCFAQYSVFTSVRTRSTQHGLFCFKVRRSHAYRDYGYIQHTHYDTLLIVSIRLVSICNRTLSKKFCSFFSSNPACRNNKHILSKYVVCICVGTEHTHVRVIALCFYRACSKSHKFGNTHISRISASGFSHEVTSI
jgi:hypothetical protein